MRSRACRADSDVVSPRQELGYSSGGQREAVHIPASHGHDLIGGKIPLTTVYKSDF